MLRSIAEAETEEGYTIAVNVLKTCDFWKDSQRLRDWFGKTWLPCYKVS